MKFVGHTMGTPGRSIEASVDVFADIGLEGIEIVCREGTPFTTEIADSEAARLAEYAASKGVPVTTITPYASDINSEDADVARAQIEELKRAIDLAALMGGKFARAYGGRAVEPEAYEAALQRSADALKEAGAYAAGKGVTVLIENHTGTVTRTGEATARLVERVGQASVRALYDPANVMHDTDEDWVVTFDVQKDIVAYVHVKDYLLREGKRHACNVGDGVVPWRAILGRLVEAGYDGCLCFEYEKKWYPEDLTDAEDGMARCFEFVKGVLEG